jgi:uncharacterized protein (TIGR00369 family)
MSDDTTPDADGRRYGVARPDELRGKSGRQVLQAMIDRQLPAPPIAQVLTFDLVEVGEGFAVFEGEPGPHLLNPAGVVHGGWALTLIDSATGCAAMTLLDEGVSYTTVETKANFTRPITPDTGKVRCEARVVGRGRRIISCEARLTSAGGQVLSHGTSTLMVFDPR